MSEVLHLRITAKARLLKLRLQGFEHALHGARRPTTGHPGQGREGSHQGGRGLGWLATPLDPRRGRQHQARAISNTTTA